MLDGQFVNDAVERAIRDVQKTAAREERIRQRASREIGTIPNELSGDELGRYVLERLGHEEHDGLADPLTVAEFVLADRAQRQTGGGGMDRRESFLDGYLNAP